jgi:hypothetical protein
VSLNEINLEKTLADDDAETMSKIARALGQDKLAGQLTMAFQSNVEGSRHYKEKKRGTLGGLFAAPGGGGETKDGNAESDRAKLNAGGGEDDAKGGLGGDMKPRRRKRSRAESAEADEKANALKMAAYHKINQKIVERSSDAMLIFLNLPTFRDKVRGCGMWCVGGGGGG